MITTVGDIVINHHFGGTALTLPGGLETECSLVANLKL